MAGKPFLTPLFFSVRRAAAIAQLPGERVGVIDADVTLA
jgi:hypothetical protein